MVNVTNHKIGSFDIENEPYKYVQMTQVRTQTELGVAFKYEVRVSDNDSINDHKNLSKSEALQLFHDSISTLMLARMLR